jgi:hypothetical protein
MLLRVIFYAILGFVIAGLFSPLIPNITNPEWGLLALLGAICGAALGFFLNRALGIQKNWNPEGLINYEASRSMLPAPLKQRYFSWLGSKLGAAPRDYTQTQSLSATIDSMVKEAVDQTPPEGGASQQ